MLSTNILSITLCCCRLVFLAFTLLTITSAKPKDKVIIIKLATIAPDGSPWVQRLYEVAEQWRDISDGKVQIRLYPNGVLGDESDIVRKMRIKMIQGAALSARGLGEIDPGIWGLCQPLLVNSDAEFDSILARVGPELIQRYWDKGYVVLGWTKIGWVRWFGIEPIRTPDDLRKTKMFMWEGSGTEKIWKDDGFHPINLSILDVLFGLDTGLISSVAMVPLSAAVSQWFGIATYMTDMYWSALLGGIVINRDTWESIPLHFREKIEATADELVADLNGSAKRMEGQAIETMVKYGLTVVKTTPAERESWQIWGDRRREHIRGLFIDEEMYDKVLRIRDEFRAADTTN